MILLRRTFFVFLFQLCLVLALSHGAYAATDSPEITKEEWGVFLHQSPNLRTADAKLNATYKKTMASLSQADKRALLNEQRAWIASRNREAFQKHAKGSPAYLDMLAEASYAREKALRQKEPASASSGQAPTDDTLITAPAQKPRANGRKIDITPKKFGESYNTLALGFRAPSFPLVPARVDSYGDNRTESYPIADGISIRFKYTNGSFEKPETITFLAPGFVGGTTAHRDNIAYALVGLLKSLSHNPAKDDKAKDVEIFGFMRSINNAFTSDSSRVWKNDGLIYVLTYLKKNDQFAMTVKVDEKNR